MSNIFVSGGAGYIGSHVCKALYHEGYHPITLDNLSSGHRWAVKWGPLEQIDITDRDALDLLFQCYRPEVVIHLAALSCVNESIAKPADYYYNNMAGTVALLSAMLKNNVDRIISSSSCTVYGLSDAATICEDHPKVPITPYGASKLMVERVLADFRKAYGFRSLSLRYFNVAGADPRQEIGEVRKRDSRLFPLLLKVATGQRPFAQIFGGDYDTSDGTCIRDYVHVSDIAAAHVAAIRVLTGEQRYDVINLGNGLGYSVMETVKMMRQVTGRKIPVKMMDRRPGDPPRLVADISRARKILDWQPQHDKLETIIKTAWNWNNHLKPVLP